MATTINWDCKTVDAYPQLDDNTNVIYNVHWRVTGVSDQLDSDGNPFTAHAIGTQQINTDNIGDFIPVEDLTNEIIAEWTKNAIGDDEVAAIESNIQSQVNSRINPTTVTLNIGGE